MDIHLVNGTSELFRSFHALPRAKNYRGEEVGAVRGVMHSIRGLIQDGATHIGIATERVLRSFRDELWPGYQTGDGIPPELLAQFSLLEEGLAAWGLTVWPMVEFEADDALASAAAKAALDPGVDQVILCSPDKILAQCVRKQRVVQRDRIRRTTRDEAGVVDRFGVSPASIPDYLALVGDPSHRLPGLPGWGAKSAAAILAKFGHIETIPDDHRLWGAGLARAGSLGATLQRERSQADLFRRLATLRTDVPVMRAVEDLAWRGPTPDLARFRRRLAVAHRAKGSP
ncbi:MAG: flap endonuclease [Acidobacteriia bacterium]|nr:flap endonuclease [Terriglobia bacterium]